MTSTLASLLLLVAAPPAPASKPVPPRSGAALCVLTVEDFKAAGVAGAVKPSANVSDPTNASCVYAGKSAATGGIELDVYDPAGDGEVDAKEAVRMSMGEGGLEKPEAVSLAGADEAYFGKASSGGPDFATLCVRRGLLVFSIGIPVGKDAKEHLLKLGAVTLERLGK